MFENLKRSEEVQDSGDTLGMSFSVLDSDIYDMTVDMAYIDSSTGGAMSLNLILVNSKYTLKHTLWMTSGESKGCKNYYLTKDNKKQYLPGFILADDLSMMTTNTPISDQKPEEKMIKVYNPELKKEVPTAKQVLITMLDKPIKVAVLKQVVDKQTKNSEGRYENTGETREVNEIDKFFHAATGLTVTEAKAGMEKGEFIDQWLEKNKGNTRNRVKGINPTAQDTQSTSVEQKPTKSLFGN